MIPWIILGHPGVAPHPYALHARAFNRRTGCAPGRCGSVPPVHRVARNVPPNRGPEGHPGGEAVDWLCSSKSQSP